VKYRITYTLLLLATLAAAGCRPYDRPEFEEIDTSETGFLIPLEGDTNDQLAFESEGYLEDRKVATKRVQIVHRWVQTGRLYWSGDWMDMVRLVKVDRSPITREWTADATSGTSSQNQAIWIESKDSVGFSVGFNCTAFIQEPDTAKFLYMYRSKSLADMMDTEIRARIQSVAAEVAAKYDLDVLRSRKQEIIDEVRKDVIPFFAARGINITTIGMFGGFTYQNPKIQDAIDQTFVVQQLKVISQAKFDAQAKENERQVLEAKAKADQSRAVAEGEADAIRRIAEATRQAKSDPLFVVLKQLEIEHDRIARWDGHYPGYLMQWGAADGGANAGPQMLVELPGARGISLPESQTAVPQAQAAGNSELQVANQ
jgi:hypothetical protein